MGCQNSKGSDADRLPNEETLTRNANAVKSPATEGHAIKLLLLGSGSSGKTTYEEILSKKLRKHIY